MLARILQLCSLTKCGVMMVGVNYRFFNDAGMARHL